MMGALSLSSPNNVGSMKQLASAFVQASGSAEEISPTAAVSLNSLRFQSNSYAQSILSKITIVKNIGEQLLAS